MNVRLRTPEQVADDLGRDVVSPRMVRRLVQERVIPCTRLSRGKVAFTDEQVAGMLAHLEQPAILVPVAESHPFPGTARSQHRRRKIPVDR